MHVSTPNHRDSLLRHLPAISELHALMHRTSRSAQDDGESRMCFSFRAQERSCQGPADQAQGSAAGRATRPWPAKPFSLGVFNGMSTTAAPSLSWHSECPA